MAQFGSALDWGSRGHGFKSRYSDQETMRVQRHSHSFLNWYEPKAKYHKRIDLRSAMQTTCACAYIETDIKNEHAVRAEVCAEV